MLRRVWKWLGEKTGVPAGANKHSPVRPAGAPSFEPLEPRLLLNADLGNIQPVPPAGVVPVNQGVYVALDRVNESIQADESPLLTIQVAPCDPKDQPVPTPISSESPAAQVERTLAREATPSSSSGATEDDPAGPAVLGQREIVSSPDISPIGIRGPPNLPGLRLVDPDIYSWQGQIIYLNFDGAKGVTYHGPVTVGPFDVLAFQAPGELVGQEPQIIAEVLLGLREAFAGCGVVFTTQRPEGTRPYSTIYIGGDDSAFAQYGSFLGLAEQVDVGNQDSGGAGLVFSEQLTGTSADGYAVGLAKVVAHEVGHLLGWVHAALITGPQGTVVPALLIDVAYAQEVHVSIAQKAADFYIEYNKGSQVLWSHLGGDDPSDTSPYFPGGCDPTDMRSWTGTTVTEGAWEEDTVGAWMRHYAEGGDALTARDELRTGLPVQLGDEAITWPAAVATWWGGTPIGAPDDQTRYASALVAAEDMWDRALVLFPANPETAYYLLGRVAHLLADMTVPAHVHHDRHPDLGPLPGSDPDAYEVWVKDLSSIENYTPNLGWKIPDPNTFDLEDLFRETAAYTDDYDSDDCYGDYHVGGVQYVYAADYRQLGRHHPESVSGEGPDSKPGLTSGECAGLAADLIPWAIEQTAVLYALFYHEVVTAANRTLAIARSGASVDEFIDGNDAYSLGKSSFEHGIVLGDGLEKAEPLYRIPLPQPASGLDQVSCIEICIEGDGSWLSWPDVHLGRDQWRYPLPLDDKVDILVTPYSSPSISDLLEPVGDNLAYYLDVSIDVGSLTEQYDLDKITVSAVYDGMTADLLARFQQAYGAYRVLADYTTEMVSNLWNTGAWSSQYFYQAVQESLALADNLSGLSGNLYSSVKSTIDCLENFQNLADILESAADYTTFWISYDYAAPNKSDVSNRLVDARDSLKVHAQHLLDYVFDGDISSADAIQLNVDVATAKTKIAELRQTMYGVQGECHRLYRNGWGAKTAEIMLNSLPPLLNFTYDHRNYYNKYSYLDALIDTLTCFTTSIVVQDLWVSPSVVQPYESFQISGCAECNTGDPVHVGTASITIQDGSQYTTPVVDGKFSRYVTAPGNPSSTDVTKIVSVVVSDGLLRSEPATAALTLRGQGSSTGFVFNQALMCRDAQEEDPWMYLEPTDVFGDADDEVTCWFELVDVYGAHTGETKWYEPDGSYWGGATFDIPNAKEEGQDCWSTYRVNRHIDLSAYPSVKDTEGKWRVEVYVDGTRQASLSFCVRYNLVKHLMCKDCDEADPWMYHEPTTNTFCQADEKAVTWCQLENVPQGLEVKWRAYEPTGALYDEWFWTVPDPSGDGRDCYDSYRLYGWMPISGTSAAQKCGDWRIEVWIRDVFGDWDLEYGDYFQLLERPAKPPVVSIVPSSDDSYPIQTISLNLSVTDDTYVGSVAVYVDDPVHTRASWDSLVVPFVSETLDLGTFSAGETVTYWAIAKDTSGNVAATPQQSFIVPVCFADPSLKTVVETALGVTDPTPTDMLALTSPPPFWNGILSLAGLEYATNLTSLSLGANQIADLSPLSGLNKLTSLCLESNRISDLSPLSSLTNLETLWLGHNQISNLSPLSGLVNISTLVLQFNQIGDLSPLSGLNKLRELHVYGNQISDLSPLSGLTNLDTLDLLANQISVLSPLLGLTNLRDLFLGNNQISDLTPLSGLTNLHTLSLPINQVSDLSPLSGLTELTILCLDRNRISDLSPLSSLTKLGILSLHTNQISDLSPLCGLTDLGTLFLGYNGIHDLSPLSALTQLHALALQWNHISDLSPLLRLQKLQSLLLMGNTLDQTAYSFHIPQIQSQNAACNVVFDGPGQIRGQKWNDLDIDGSRDPGEPGLVGWTIYLDQDQDGVLDADEPSAITEADGWYVIEYLSANAYYATEVEQSSWIRTYPTTLPQAIALAVGQAMTDVDFGSATINERPHRPECHAPTDGATEVRLTPTLESSDFSDPDAGDTHAATQWQIDNNSDFSSPVWDDTDTDLDKTSQAVPSGVLLYATTYHWRVRYQDSRSAWSEWSDSSSFTTQAAPSFVPCDMNWDGLVSIIGDVPPFVRMVYFGDSAWYEQQFPSKDPVLPGDCNGDGILSIIGDVPGFVNRVYFGQVALERSAVQSILAGTADTCRKTTDTADANSPPNHLPVLPGLVPCGTAAEDLAGQVIFLDFDGAQSVTYNGSLMVGPFDVPAFQAPAELAGQEQEIIADVLARLEETFAGSGVNFTTEQPTASEAYSTIYIGGDGSVFYQYGSFLGVAEQADAGNQDRSDDAWVFTERLGQGLADSNLLVDRLTRVIAHEVGHLLGYAHTLAE